MRNNNFLLYLFILTTIGFSSCVEEKINDRDFAISNTEEISMIVMSDKSGNKIELKKDGKNWTINDNHKVWDRQIDYTLEVMKDIRVKSSVSSQKMDFVIKTIATSGVKVEVYNEKKKVKSYYIGGNTSDHQGTYMIMEGSGTAYILTIPNRHPGILNPKYGLEGTYVNANRWREPITISIDKKEIHSIKVEDIKQEESSFTLDTRNNKLYDYKEKEVDALSEKLQDFIISFNKLECGVYKPKLKSSDFILIKKIYIQKENSIDSLIIYDKTELQNTTKEHNTSVENLYAKWNNSDLVIIQKNIFNKVLITISELKE